MMPPTVGELIDARLDLYRRKQEKTDLLGPEDYTKHEVLEHTIEALEWLRAEVERAQVPT